MCRDRGHVWKNRRWLSLTVFLLVSMIVLPVSAAEGNPDYSQADKKKAAVSVLPEDQLHRELDRQISEKLDILQQDRAIESAGDVSKEHERKHLIPLFQLMSVGGQLVVLFVLLAVFLIFSLYKEKLKKKESTR